MSTDGATGLFRGLPPQIATQLLTSASLFGLEDNIYRGLLYGLNKVRTNKNEQTYEGGLLPHCIAGTSSLTAGRTPPEVLRTRPVFDF